MHAREKAVFVKSLIIKPLPSNTQTASEFTALIANRLRQIRIRLDYFSKQLFEKVHLRAEPPNRIND